MILVKTKGRRTARPHYETSEQLPGEIGRGYGLRYWLRFLTNPSYPFSLTSEGALSVLKLECQ